MGVATAGLIVSAGVSAYQIASTESQKNDAKKQIANFERQELRNPNKDIQISTLKSEQQTRANLVNVATSVDALQRTGTRGVLGGIPKVNQSSVLLQEQISRDLERQEVERSIRIARGEENIRAIKENRETGALAGLHNQLDTAKHEQANAVGNLIQTGLGFAENKLNQGELKLKQDQLLFDKQKFELQQNQDIFAYQDIYPNSVLS